MSCTTTFSIEKKDYEFYGFNTSNAYKIRIFFDLLGITSYNYHAIDITKGEQFAPEFLKLNPNNKVPVIVDNTVVPPLVVIESGAILIYLAEKYGKFLPDNKTNPRERTEVLQWLAWQISTQGPFIGQYAHFLHYAPEKIPYAIERYEKETHRIYSVLDGHLSTRKYVAGSELSIADVAIYGWAFYLRVGFLPNYETKYPNVVKWLDTVETLQEFKTTLEYAVDAFQKKSMAAKAAAISAQSKQE